jgi:hypothetical protein
MSRDIYAVGTEMLSVSYTNFGLKMTNRNKSIKQSAVFAGSSQEIQSRNSTHFVESKSSLPLSQEPENYPSC